MLPSSPDFLSSFDPALQLHSEDPNIAFNPPSELFESFSDDIEAIHQHRVEQTRNKVVIQHRSWNLSERRSGRRCAKRKAAEIESPQAGEPKRQRILGGFVDDEDDDDENEDLAAFRDDELKTQFELQENTEPEPFSMPALSEQPPISTHIQQPTTFPLTPMNSELEIASRPAPRKFQIKTCNGKTHSISLKKTHASVSYEQMIASRSETEPGKAKKSYYGIDIHQLLDDAAKDIKTPKPKPSPQVNPSIEKTEGDAKQKKLDSMMWTEKYRARKFTDLIGDERTHRSVLHWLKAWEPIVFPGLARSRTKKADPEDDEEGRMHRKVLLLSGPPGLGKTTLAHVCAKQAGYEVLEINASDERSKDVVKGRIRDALGTENVKGSNVEIGQNKVRRAAKPVCVIVDEVDGVVGGAGSGGEGGFMKALIDLVVLDQRNSKKSAENGGQNGKKRKGDTFRFLRPLILVCNDLYHPSLRPLRASSIAEMIHVRQAPLENVVQRIKSIFVREGIPCDGDAARRLCEAAWGLSARRQRNSKNSGSAEGDIRSVLVVAEGVAHKLRNERLDSLRLTRNWLEQRVLSASTEGGSFTKEMSRGGVREIVNRVFTEAAGFTDAPVGKDSFQDRFSGPNSRVPVGVADLRKRHGINRLREMIDSSGEHDRCVNDCFASYPIQEYQDDTFLSKPNAAYDWLHFHDLISSKVHSSQEWELYPYLSQSVLGFHHLFATAGGKTEAAGHDEDDDDAEEEHPFPNRAILTGFHTSFSAPLVRLFRSPDNVIVELVPYLVRMLSPDVKPVIVRGTGESRSTASVRKESERVLVQSAVRVMVGLGVTFEQVRVENEGGNHGGWAYRMEPPIDSLITFSKIQGTSLANSSGNAPVRYAVRQALDQEYRQETLRKQSSALSASAKAARAALGKSATEQGEAARRIREGLVKRDFFGRVIQETPGSKDLEDGSHNDESSKAGRKVWVTFHEGFSNAVRKPISMGELLSGL
ncbi:Chromosome transmission fidelity protein 18 [Penicillium verhagenii]|nr:Chromosome transmission fidelity protein 18 [Penicillium verhagenii]